MSSFNSDGPPDKRVFVIAKDNSTPGNDFLVSTDDAELEVERIAANEFLKKQYPNFINVQVTDDAYIITLDESDGRGFKTITVSKPVPGINTAKAQKFAERFKSKGT